MKKGFMPHYLHWPRIHHQERSPKVADGSRDALMRQKTKQNKNRGYSLPNTPGFPFPVVLGGWEPCPVLSPGLEALCWASHLIPLPRLEYWQGDVQVQLLTTTLIIVWGSRLALRATLMALLSFLFLFLSYKVARFRVTKCAYENKQLSFIWTIPTPSTQINEMRNKFALHYVMLWVLTYEVYACMAVPVNGAPLSVIISLQTKERWEIKLQA